MENNVLVPTNGWLMHDLIIWNEFDQRGYVSKAYKINISDYRCAANDIRNRLHEQVNSLLRLSYQSTHQLNLQVHWCVDSNYSVILKSYNDDTEKLAKNKWTYKTRKERYNRYKDMSKNREIRQENCYLFASYQIKNRLASHTSNEEKLMYYDTELSNAKQIFSNYYNKIVSIMGTDGIEVTPLNDEQHFRVMFNYANPGYFTRTQIDPYKSLLLAEKERQKLEPNYVWQKETIEYLIYKTGIKGNTKRKTNSEFGFIQDDCYNDIIILERWGTNTFPGQYYELTSLPMLDYSISCNIYPVALNKEKKKLIDEIDRLKTEMMVDSKAEIHVVSINSKRERLQNYEEGISYPFECHYIIKVWDKNSINLKYKVNQIKTAIESMSGAGYYELANERTQIQFYHIGFPGWIFNKKKHYRLAAENTYLSDRLPISSTFTGHSENPEALYDGTMNNIVGIKNFINGTPQMCSCFGMSGAGKSLQLIDLLSQTECYYNYTVIVEEGNSYGTYVNLMNEETLLVNPSSDFTINYFDTRGLPVTNNQISSAAALVAKMCGDVDDQDKMRLRRAMLTFYIQHTYSDKFDLWKRDNEELLIDISKHALASQLYTKDHMPKSTESIIGWCEYREKITAKDKIALNLFNTVSEEDVTIFIKTRAKDLRNYAHAWYKNEDYPVHSDLLATLSTVPSTDHAEDEVKKIATLLSQWAADAGDSGKIFDGATNINLTGKIAHFELGMIPESSDYMKPVIVFLINNIVRNHIMTLPRSSRKRIIFEEAGRLLGTPGGGKIISEGYAQMRKFNTWVLTIIQQYEKFKNSSIRATITGNCKQYILLAQRDQGDLNDMAKDIYLPKVLRGILSGFPQPEKVGYSCFAYHFDDTPKPKYGAVKNIVSKEMYFAASTKGDEVEERDLALAKSDNKLDLVDTVYKIVAENNNKN